MGLFKQRRPRGFDRQYIFSRKDRSILEDIEKDAESEQNPTDDNKRPEHKYRMRGVFLNATKYARRRNERRKSGAFILSTGLVLILIILLIAVWKFLLYFNC